MLTNARKSNFNIVYSQFEKAFDIAVRTESVETIAWLTLNNRESWIIVSV